MQNELGFEGTATSMTHDVARLLRARFERKLASAELEITPGEARTLRYISRYPDLPQTTIAAMMSVHPGTLQRAVESLLVRGLIERNADGGDRRLKRMRITQRAEPMLSRINKLAHDLRREVSESMSARDTQAVRQGLEAMLVALNGDEASTSQEQSVWLQSSGPAPSAVPAAPGAKARS